MSRILIIGGTGIIGKEMTNILLENGGHEIVNVCRGTGGTEIKGVKTLLADRTDLPDFEKTIRPEGTFDCVVDMICNHPAEARQAVELFHGKTSQYIFCSTAEVYDSRHMEIPAGEEVHHPGP